MANARIFMSYDLENDEDLHDLLLEQSLSPSAGFEISARSDAGTTTDRWDERVRRRICEADEVIVICGEHTESSPRVSAELRIAQEEQKPYFLLWGRRESMCTKPVGAKRDDGMYSWTWEILQNQIITTLRNARPLEIAECYKRPSRDPGRLNEPLLGASGPNSEPQAVIERDPRAQAASRSTADCPSCSRAKSGTMTGVNTALR